MIVNDSAWSVGGQTEARAQLSSTIIDYHEPLDQGFTLKYGQKRVPYAEMRFFFWTHARLYDLPTGRPTPDASLAITIIVNISQGYGIAIKLIWK